MPLSPIGRDLYLPSTPRDRFVQQRGDRLFGYRIFTPIPLRRGPIIEFRISYSSSEFSLPGSTVPLYAFYLVGWEAAQVWRLQLEEGADVEAVRVDRFQIPELDIALYAGTHDPFPTTP